MPLLLQEAMMVDILKMMIMMVMTWDSESGGGSTLGKSTSAKTGLESFQI